MQLHNYDEGYFSFNRKLSTLPKANACGKTLPGNLF